MNTQLSLPSRRRYGAGVAATGRVANADEGGNFVAGRFRCGTGPDMDAYGSKAWQ